MREDVPDAGSEERLVGADRVLAVLKELARYADPAALDDIARALDIPKSTAHRALSSLKRAGLADQSDRGLYVLGDEFLRLAFTHAAQRPDHARVQPVLEALATRFGETAHYGVLDGRDVVYRAKVDPPTGAVRLTSVVGGRNPAHATGLGKLLLSTRLTTLQAVRAWIGDTPLPQRTDRTLTTARALHADLERIRAQGFSTDDQENERGVNCLAVPLPSTGFSAPVGAVSVSGLSYRTPLADLVGSVEEIQRLVNPFVAETA